MIVYSLSNTVQNVLDAILNYILSKHYTQRTTFWCVWIFRIRVNRLLRNIVEIDRREFQIRPLNVFAHDIHMRRSCERMIEKV